MVYYRPSDKYPENWHKLRFYIFKRDNYTCQCCGRSQLKHPECHHVRPIWLGGSHHPNNLICVCHKCHRRLDEEIFRNKGMRYR